LRSLAKTLPIGLAVVALLVADFATAQTCYTLQAELAHLQSRGGGSSRDRARYERAWREQASVLARTEARARNAGCYGGGFLFFRREPDRSCRQLIPKIRDMQGNLAKLDRLRRSGGGGDNSRRIRELQAILRDRGCSLEAREASAPRREESPFNWRGTYRTVCVRPCDGYYFPISFSTTPDRFPEDAQTCAARCPGTDAKLFFYSNPGGSPEEMQSIDGASYSALPTAFQFRTQYNPGCGCRPATGFGTTAAETSRPDLDTMVEAVAQLPRPRPEPGLDPETIANRRAGFVPGPRRGPQPPPAEIATTADGRPIRVVGPSYWASPEQDAVVLTPVPN
jgi:hypothetical protein